MLTIPQEPSLPVTPAPGAPIRWFQPLVANAVGNSVVDHVCLGKFKLQTGMKVGLVVDPKFEFQVDLAVTNPYLDAVCTTAEFGGDPRSLPEPTHGRTWNYLIENTEVARLRVPESVSESVLVELAARGVESGDRIICIHAREPGYKHLPDANHESERFVDPKTFMLLAEHWANRGFKVVRIGDPSCTPFPRHPRIVDAAHWPEKRLIHDMVLIGMAEALIATDSGVWPIGVALGTPTLLSNSCHGMPAMGTVRHWFPWEPGHAVLHKRLFVKGEPAPAEVGVALFKGTRWQEVGDVVHLEDNTLEQLIAASTALLERHGKEISA